MSKKKKCPECPAGEKWAVPYADFLSLLLALFIALYAISASNTEKTKALKEEFIKIFDYAPRPEQAQPILPLVPEIAEPAETQTNQQSQSNEEQKTQASTAKTIQRGGILEQVEEGIVLRLPTNVLFPINAGKLEDQDLKLFLKRIVEIIKKLPKNIKIDVRGFANNPNIKNTEYKDNYALASARAMFIMNILIQNGISPEAIFFSSQGQYSKANEIKDEEERLKQSNKVEIYFFVNEQESQTARKVLQLSN